MKVGRTVPTVREAIEEELERWKEFKESLRKGERKAFERMVEGCEKHISAISQAKRPEPFQAGQGNLVQAVMNDSLLEKLVLGSFLLMCWWHRRPMSVKKDWTT